MASSTSTPPPASSGATNDDKLSGQLIIKAQLGDDIRKMMIHNEELTLDELVLMMERIFTGKISNTDQLTIKYLDDDGDKITLSNDSDLTVALHFHKLLRLFVYVNGAEQTPANAADQQGDHIDAKTFRQELQAMRDSVQTILDRLQLPTGEVSDAATTRELDAQNAPSVPSNNVQPNVNQFASHEHQTMSAPQVQPTETHRMPTSHFVPTPFKNEHEVRTNTFGPPPATLPSMPPASNSTTPRFPPATTPNSSARPPIHSPNTPPPSTFGQQPAAAHLPPPPQQGGFYGQQQSLYQQRPPHPSFPAYLPQQHATPNGSFAQPPPPAAAQQPYGGYPPQTPYYNPSQQYPQS